MNSDTQTSIEIAGQVRLLLGDNGEKLKSIGPSGAAKVAGWRGDDVPGAGDEVGFHYLHKNYLHLDAQVLGVATESRAKEASLILFLKTTHPCFNLFCMQVVAWRTTQHLLQQGEREVSSTNVENFPVLNTWFY